MTHTLLTAAGVTAVVVRKAAGYQPSDTVRIGDLFQERGLEVTVIGVRLAYSGVGVPVVANIAGANP
jgi:hypothetical protein